MPPHHALAQRALISSAPLPLPLPLPSLLTLSRASHLPSLLTCRLQDFSRFPTVDSMHGQLVGAAGSGVAGPAGMVNMLVDQPTTSGDTAQAATQSTPWSGTYIPAAAFCECAWQWGAHLINEVLID